MEATTTGWACADRFRRNLKLYPPDTQERIFDIIKMAERNSLLATRLAEIRALDYPDLLPTPAAQAIERDLERLNRATRRRSMGALSDAEKRLQALPDDMPRSASSILNFLKEKN